MRNSFSNRITVICFLFLLLNSSAIAQNIADLKINESFQNKPLKEFLTVVQEKYGVKVFYKDNWVEPFTITKTFNNTPLVQALNNVFYAHELSYDFFQNDGIVVFRRIADTRSRYDDLSQVLIIGNPMNIGRYKSARLKGRVVDGKTGETLVGAVVYDTKLEKGSTTNGSGAFELVMPTGEHQLKISFVGFESSNVKIKLIEDGEAEFQIFEESLSIGEVTIIGQEADLPRAQMSMVQMSSAELKELPALMGEVDVLKGLTMLAGVQTVSELSSGFNVRGGNTDQNLILVNGSPVFNSSHLFGFLSLINPDVVEDVRLFKGGMPIKYGERVASVMEVDFKEGNNEAIAISGGLGLINSRLALEGPLTKNKKLTFIVGGRASYTNWILKELPDITLSQSVTHFYDASGKVTYKFDQHNKISVMAYMSNDEFSTSSQSITQYGNILGNLKLNTRFNEKLYGELDVSHSEYDYRLTDKANDVTSKAYYLDNLLKYSSGGYHFKWHPDLRNNAEMGFKLVLNQISPGEIISANEVTVIHPEKLYDEKTFEWAAYIGDEFEILPQFSVVLGLRYSQFKNIGTPVVYLYDPGKPMSPETVIDSMTFGANDVAATYGGFEPRFSLNYDLSVYTSLKLNYQRTRQNTFQLSNNAVASPAETWKSADYHLAPLISDQIAIGIENSALIKDVDISIELYYKNLQNLIEYKNGAQVIMNQQIETDLISSEGYSYGIELSAKKRIGRLTGYTSYVYSRTMRKNTSQFEQENLWNGNYYPSIYDKPHDFSFTTTYDISRRWRFSGNFVFISGRPVTLPELKYSFSGESLVLYSDRNKYRMPPYHRLDLSITLDENLRRKRSWKGSWTFSVYNVYGRHNPYSVYYKKGIPGPENDYKRYSLYKLSVIGIPVPSITYNFKF